MKGRNAPSIELWMGGRVWLITPVLKIGERNAPGVQIPPHPPSAQSNSQETEELISLEWRMTEPSRTYSLSLGKKYGVADKTISKWCEYYNLPSKKKSIKSYTDDQWLLI